jgi:xanthosine utilization system XapX-like protein
MRKLMNIVKIALMLSVVALAIIGTLYVLDVFAAEAAREVMAQLMKLVGIWTGASLVLLIIALLGSKSVK